MENLDPVLESLKEHAWRETAAIDRDLEDGRIDEHGWHAAMASLIKPAYLSGNNPYAQAGHSGNAETWQASRGFLADALHRDGSFLDVGCASGILMESVQNWGAKKNLAIEPHGLEIIRELAELARQRLPHWANRVHVGNIRNWKPVAERFDFVLIRPEYAPVARRTEMVLHILENVLQHKGRLIVFVGTEEADFRRVESSLSGPSFTISGRAEIPHPKDSRLMRRLLWIDR